MLEGARRSEEQREDSLKQLAWDQMQAANLSSEERAENKRYIRRYQMEKKEREMEEAITKVWITHEHLIIIIMIVFCGQEDHAYYTL